MHIKRIEIKNWLGIKELLFSPGKINKVSGDSGAGKTSLVEALEKLFSNRNRRTEVIRHDTDEAELFVELDDGMQATRKVRTEKSDYLKVKHDSKTIGGATETFLKNLINGDIFRPIEFVKKDPKEQAQIILRMLKIDWTVEDIKSWFGEVPEADYQLHILQILKQIEDRYYEERTKVNNEINLLKLNIEGIKRDLPQNYDGERWRSVNLQELYNNLHAAEAANKRLADAQAIIAGLALRIEDIKQRAATATESKKLEYGRQRDSLKSSIERINDNIQFEQTKIDDVDQRIRESNLRLDNELEQSIERLKNQYAAKKQTAREEIQQEADFSRNMISDYKERLAEKKSELDNIGEHELKDLQKITDHESSLIKLEEEKSGNAQAVIDEVEWKDPEPLKKAADEAAQMKEYLREWERMKDIIREKLAPKEERSAELTAKITKARELPKELLKTAALPVDGLSVDKDGNIRVNDTLIDGLSDGEALDFAFKMAKAQSGPLKVICIDGWQDLGSKQREIIEAAKEDDYQYFLLETVEGEELNISSVEG